MKWPWNYLFDYMYKRYVELLIKNKALQKQIDDLPLVIGNFEWDSKPSQADKPSPHSHMQKSEVYVRLGRAYPDSEGFQRFKVANTNSMEPWIDDNAVVVGSRNISKLTKGDVVVYEGTGLLSGHLVVHKIKLVSDSGKSFWIKGDNNFRADGWIRIDKIVWRVVDVGYAEPQREDD